MNHDIIHSNFPFQGNVTCNTSSNPLCMSDASPHFLSFVQSCYYVRVFNLYAYHQPNKRLTLTSFDD